MREDVVIMAGRREMFWLSAYCCLREERNFVLAYSVERGVCAAQGNEKTNCPKNKSTAMVVKKGKIMFSLSRLFFFGITNMIGVDSCVFLIVTTRVGLKTRLNGVKSIRFEQS